MAIFRKRMPKGYLNALGALYGDQIPDLTPKAPKRIKLPGDVPTEDQEHTAFANWLRLKKVRFYHPPNGGQRDYIEAAKLKRLGVSPGIPDIVIPIPKGGYHSLYIELKRTKGGTVSVEQKEWIDWLNLNGHWAEVAKGANAAIKIVEKYLGL